IVFSHLRWSFVWQRPQHLMTRMAQQRRVFFIEEPIACDGDEGGWNISEPHHNVIVCQPRTFRTDGGFSDGQMLDLAQLVSRLVTEQGIGDRVAWFYTPMALPLVDSLAPHAIVYDCMDELSAFLHAPPQLLARETELLARADLVFTGGPSLYEAKKNRHPSVYCFSSSVDASHFGRAPGNLSQPPEQRVLAPAPL